MLFFTQLHLLHIKITKLINYDMYGDIHVPLISFNVYDIELQLLFYLHRNGVTKNFSFEGESFFKICKNNNLWKITLSMVITALKLSS